MDKPLTEKDWGELQNVLHGRDSKWQAIGIQLHVAHDELTRIRQEHGQNLEDCNREMQISWLKSGKATWGALVAALGSGPVGLFEDARRLEEKHLGARIHSATASINYAESRETRGVHECNPETENKLNSNLSPIIPELMMNHQVQKSLLNEQLEWLLKMGFTVEDIMKWAQTKKKLSADIDDGNFNTNSSSNNNNNGGTLSANPASTPLQQPNSDNMLVPSSAHVHTESPRLQEIPSTPVSPPPVAPSDLTLSLSIPADRGEAHTPSGSGRKILMRSYPRKRANSSQGKQPKAKRDRPSKASLMPAAALSSGEEASSSRGREQRSPLRLSSPLRLNSPLRLSYPLKLSSPVRLTVEKSRQRATTLLKKEMMQVLEEIEQHPAAEEFIDPVDRERAANYYDIITEPMCLADMATKVYEGIYKTPKMFCEDFDLIISNCVAYNGEESEYTQQARQLEAEFYNLVDVYFDDSEIDMEQHRSLKTVMPITSPREPTESSNTGGESTPKRPTNATTTAANTTGGGGPQEEDFVRDEEVEETHSGPGEEMMEVGQQLPRTRSGVTAASSDSDTVEDSEDDLPSYKDIFTTPSKVWH